MAVRDDFTAGEVLAAADLNDTFASKADYPSGGSDGDLLTKSGTTTAWAAPSVAGLTLITAESFSAVSSVSVNGCFTSTYANYRIVCKMLPSNSGQSVRIRVRASGADLTSSDYFWTKTSGSGTGDTSMRLIESTGASDMCNFSLDMTSPAIAELTNLVSIGNDAGGFGASFHSGGVRNATAYDGFTLFPSGGTMSGTIRIYGYRN